MIDPLIIVVAGVVVVALATVIGPRFNIAGPLVLLAIGAGVSLLPFVPAFAVNPEVILIGVLPPLLYSAAVQLPAIEFRRDFAPIAGLSVLLVVFSSLVLGLFFWAVIPGLGLALGIALGAILSPTDAVATSIAKRLGISPRVVTMLEGESLLNDATALVLLRTAVAAVASGFAFGDALASFAWAVVIALALGAVVGWGNLRLRERVSNPAANTALSFTVPFIAYLPTEHLGGSGLVAAVVAGIVTGQGAARRFTPEQRISDRLNWRTVELVLEGGVFLVFGLELKDIVTANIRADEGLWHGAWLALSALGITLAVRAVYVSWLIWIQGRRSRRVGRHQERVDDAQRRLDRFEEAYRTAPEQFGARAEDPARAARRIGWMRTRISRTMADLDYYRDTPLGARHGSVIVWAGMRGVVTLAAAQTLPVDTTQRPLLIFVAFLVALFSLVLQGLTLPALVRRVGLAGDGGEGPSREEQRALDAELRDAAIAAVQSGSLVRRDGEPFPAEMIERAGARLVQPPDEEASTRVRDSLELRLASIEAMRRRLHDVGRDGHYSTAALRHALAELDADQLSLELRIDDGEDD
ncbi:monovalent cation:H+ antiporter, CPA1 family [Microbacterium sp. ru370.1]|uniref:cation:proton antiporter n=1 Tax=unclassified Microbacterium TaxID=2609290 RepID=UPI00087F1AF0|nr:MULTISPECIES: sodium:proton antiporter [unclassified Microbacterium]SDO41436.1 monovalent cation:H+ antiporter, CPA1 family [Microbacterium sp. ru370.1]SIT79869.1 monovalent cation:H+ antiporter, CPA1 family [Microbacterium sp. RU1D]